MSRYNDYATNYVRTGNKPISYIANIETPEKGYPKLLQLHKLKANQVSSYSTNVFGKRVATNDIISTLKQWIDDGVKFDVVMVGALVDNQFVPLILKQIPVARLLSKPGYFFVWATTKQIQEVSKIVNGDNFGGKFRRLEELVFMSVDKNLPYYPGRSSGPSVLQNTHWHCWMCITGTVRRKDHGHLIHCNVDTDLQIGLTFGSGCVPDAMYRVTENFSNSTRRLHIIPTKVGYNHYVKVRRGWVIMGPDVPIDNFNLTEYRKQLTQTSMVKEYPCTTGSGKQMYYLVPSTPEIEVLRPKSPVRDGRKV